MKTLDTFTQAYIIAALWSSTDDNDNPLDKNYSIEDIAPECLDKMIEDCVKFQAENMSIIQDDLTQAGVDFWLTRNGHGAGFWDGGWPENGDKLTENCKQYSNVDLYVGDDGLIYC